MRYMALRAFFIWFKFEVIFPRGGRFLLQTRKKETHIGPVVVEIFSYKHIDRHTPHLFFMKVSSTNLYFPASLWNRLISAGLKPVLCHTEISLHFNQFSRNNNIKIIKINTILASLVQTFSRSGLTKLVLIL